jgi:hypothetical protein
VKCDPLNGVICFRRCVNWRSAVDIAISLDRFCSVNSMMDVLILGDWSAVVTSFNPATMSSVLLTLGTGMCCGTQVNVSVILSFCDSHIYTL